MGSDTLSRRRLGQIARGISREINRMHGEKGITQIPLARHVAFAVHSLQNTEFTARMGDLLWDARKRIRRVFK